MTSSLSQRQALRLGSVVAVAFIIAAVGLFGLGQKQGWMHSSTELVVGFPEVHDLHPGTPVRLRGLEVGHVVGIDYPDSDDPQAFIRVRLKVQTEYARRLRADASAQLISTGLFGGKVVSLTPGTPQAGPLTDGVLQPGKPDPMTEATTKLGEAASELKQIAADIRSGKGTVGKLINDDGLYTDLKGLANDSRKMVQQTEGAVSKVEDTVRATKSTVEGVNQSWLGRRFIENATTILVRPRHRRDFVTYNAGLIFEPGTAILTQQGRHHLGEVAAWLKSGHPKEADVVVVALCDPNDTSQTSASAAELSRQQAEAAVEYLKSLGAHKRGWVSTRKFTALGLGQGPSPVKESKPLPASYLQVNLFVPS